MQAHEILIIGELMRVKVGDSFFKTKLLELLPGNRMTVFHPTEKGALVPMETDETYTLRFYRENGMYSFDARLLDKYVKDDMLLCLFEATGEVIRTQRRRSYRLPIMLDVKLWAENAEGKLTAAPLTARTLDISEHGALLTCASPLEPDTMVRMDLKLSPAETMTLRGQVLRCEQPPLCIKKPYRIVILFVNGFDQQRLRRYILRQQIAERKKKNQEVLP